MYSAGITFRLRKTEHVDVVPQGRTLEKNQRDRENRAKAAAKHVVMRLQENLITGHRDDGGAPGARSPRNRH